MDHIDLGSAPANERCGQLGVDEDYPARASRECLALINQFLRKLGIPPIKARFRVMGNLHDFGTYYSVVIEFDPRDADAVTYAERCDEQAPEHWDVAARAELEAALRWDQADRNAGEGEERS